MLLVISFILPGKSKNNGSNFISSLTDSPKTKSVKELQKCINSGSLNELYEMLIFPYEPDKEGGFSEFVDTYLDGCKVKETEDGCDLIGSKDTFHLEYAEDSKQFYADEFFMEYTVKYTSYIGDTNFTPQGNGDYTKQSDGTVLITNHLFKTDSTTIEYDLILGGNEYGENTKLLPDAKIDIQFDKNYKPSKLGDVTNVISEDTLDGPWAKIEDGNIVLNRYYISKTFAKELADRGLEFYEEASRYYFEGYNVDDYDLFCSNHEDIMVDTEGLKEEYEATFAVFDYLKRNDIYNVYDSVDYVAESWDYPTEFDYSDGEFQMDITLHADVYSGENIVQSNEPSTLTFVFEPGEDGFKLKEIY